MLTTLNSRLAASAGLAALAAGGLVAATPAHAADSGPTVIAKNLPGPLSVAVNGDNVVYVNGTLGTEENPQGVLYRVVPGKDPKIVYRKAGVHEIEGVATKGRTTYFIADNNLMKRAADGFVTKVAEIGAYEADVNPDGDTSYGFPEGTSQECLDAWPTEGDIPPAQYTGIVESHAYATAVDGDTIYVADAAGNSIVKVEGGEVSTVAVLPPVPLTITEDDAAALGIPEACVGETYRFEGVPTDVEVGFNDLLYVSSLPGGEIPGRGSVLAIDPLDGSTTTVADGFSGATGVAVAGDGTLYVSQLFAGEITEIPLGGEPTAFASPSNPAAVEVKGERLYVTANVFGPKGKVLRYQR
jgi:hypothetical protein